MTELKLNLDGLVTTTETKDEGICAYDLIHLFVGQMRAQTFSEETINKALITYVEEYIKDNNNGE